MVSMRWELAPWSEPWSGRAARRSSPFSSTWDQTLRLLADETDRLDAGLVTIELDVSADEIARNAQQLRPGKAPAHSGVRVKFDSKHGELTYASAEFWVWRDNVRAVAKSLEVLRSVDRWGVSHGEQYVGFRPAIGAGAGYDFATPKDAITWLTETAVQLAVEPGTPKDLHRRISKLVHPDQADLAGVHDPDGTKFLRLAAAAKSLTDAGVM